MKDDFEISMTRIATVDGKRMKVSATVRVPCLDILKGNELDRAMEICNRHFGDPEKHIGGPELPPAAEERKPKR